MAQFGSIQTIVVCMPVSEPTNSQQQTICPVVDGRFSVPANIQAYLVDPSQQNNIETAVGPFDYQYAAGIWAFGFSMVVGLYAVSVGIGSVLDMIRRS